MLFIQASWYLNSVKAHLDVCNTSLGEVGRKTLIILPEADLEGACAPPPPPKFRKAYVLQR
jgi:hypothetical protein